MFWVTTVTSKAFEPLNPARVSIATCASFGRNPRIWSNIFLCRNQHLVGSSRNALSVLYFSGSCVFQTGSKASSGVAGPTRTPSASTSAAPATVSRNAGMPDSALAPAPVKNTTFETEGLAKRRAARSTDAAAAARAPLQNGHHSAETKRASASRDSGGESAPKTSEARASVRFSLGGGGGGASEAPSAAASPSPSRTGEVAARTPPLNGARPARSTTRRNAAVCSFSSACFFSRAGTSRAPRGDVRSSAEAIL